MNRELKKIIKIIKSLDEEVKKEYKAKLLGIFGSYTRDEQKEKSDLDVLVNFLEGASLFDFVGLADFLEEKLGIRVDVVPADTIRKEIKRQVLKEAIYF